MKKALVTGATSGIGYACAKALIGRGYDVIGIGRRNSVPDGVIPLCVDLTNKNALQDIGKTVLAQFGGELDMLVNAAGVGYFAPHEELSAQKLRDMIELNLLAPLELTRQLLRPLKKSKGYIINIASITAKKPSPQGAAYSASKAGLAHFGDSLFEEARKSGVKVTTIIPDVTKTSFFDNTWFCPADDEATYLTSECIADTLMHIISMRTESVMSEIVIKPQKVGIVSKKIQLSKP